MWCESTALCMYGVRLCSHVCGCMWKGCVWCICVIRMCVALYAGESVVQVCVWYVCVV